MAERRIRRVKAGGGRAAPGKFRQTDRPRAPARTARSRAHAAARRTAGSGGKPAKAPAKRAPGPGGRGGAAARLTEDRRTAGGRMETRGELRDRATRGRPRASPVAKPRAQGGHGGKERRASGRGEVETLEPGGEIGETRDMGAGGSAADLPGRAPETKVVMHHPGEGPGRARKPGGD